MKTGTILLILNLFVVNSYAQSYGKYNNLPFVARVKLYDEFIERFNDQDSSFLKKNLSNLGNGLIFDRASLIYSLFDAENPEFQIEESIDNIHFKDSTIQDSTVLIPFDTLVEINPVLEFIEQVTDSNNPIYLSFYDDSWYAKLETRFQYKGSIITVSLTLKNEFYEEQQASKWVIVGVNSGLWTINWLSDKGRLLNPASHNTYFMDLRKALEDTTHLASYFSRNRDYDQVSVFIYLLNTGELKFVQVDKVTYHLLQIDGWILQIEDFNRRTTNAGWLISGLIRADKGEKELYKKNLLNLDYE